MAFYPLLIGYADVRVDRRDPRPDHHAGVVLNARRPRRRKGLRSAQ